MGKKKDHTSKIVIDWNNGQPLAIDPTLKLTPVKAEKINIKKKTHKWSVEFEKCDHSHLIVVKETPTDGLYMEMPKRYVVCKLCGAYMNIRMIEYAEIEVPITPDTLTRNS